MSDDDNLELDEALLQQGESGASDKEKIALQSLRESGTTQEDVSRSTLHYGEEPETDQTQRPDDEGGLQGARHPAADEIGRTDGGASSTPPPVLPVDDTALASEQAGSAAPALAEYTNPANDAAPDDDMSSVVSRVDHDQPTGLSASGPGPDASRAAPINPSVAAKEAGSPADTGNRPEADPTPQPTEAAEVPPTELWVDQSGIASDQPGAVIGRVEMNGTGGHEGYTYTVSDDRFEVVGTELKLKDDVSLGQDELGTLSVDVTATKPGGATLTQSLEFEVIDTPEISADTGFRASYFDVDHRLSELDQIDWSSDPTHEEVVSEINYKNGRGSFWEGGATDTFGARITGNVSVEEGGSFKFFLGGDDGVILLVNGEEVIENDGLHGYQTRSGELELEPGTHHIEVRYFENYGHAGLKLEWDGPGTDGRELVTGPDMEDAQTVNGMPITFELDIPDADADLASGSSHLLDGLPVGTEVQAGEMSAVAGETGAVDLTGWDVSLLAIKTPVDFVGDVAAQLITTTQGETDAVVSNALDLGFTVNDAHLPLPNVDMGTGFRASYFDVDHRLSELDQIDWSSDPTHEEVVSEINYKNGRGSFWEGGATDTFGARITGNVSVEEGGSFKFFLGGDDGVILLVNGEEVIENDGLHGYQTRSGEIELEPGTHHIEVRYFENYGHAGLKLEWDGPGTDGRELVTGQNDLSVEENGMIAVRIGDTDLSDAAQIQISGLPPDTILMSGNDVAVSDGTQMDISGWDLDLLEIAPPPGFEGQISGDITSTDTAFNGESVTGTSSFVIEVGDAEGPSSAHDGDDDAQMLASSEESGADGSWVETADNEDSSDAHGENAMEEPVVENADSGQHHDMNDTYERSDW